MGAFEIIKQNSSLSQANELPNKELLYVSYATEIPAVSRGVSLTIQLDPEGKIIIDNAAQPCPDPSTIYFHLPVFQEANVPGLPYWPHYIEFTPGQRYNYLNWLHHVEQPTEMGYVFLYYYGLERQLLIGDFEKAFNEIIKLRNAHENKSFLQYSANAIVHASILRNKLDYLVDLHKRTDMGGYSNSMFYLAYKAGLELGEDQLLLIFYKTFIKSRKAIKENRPLFVSCLKRAMEQRYGKSSLMLKDFDISNTAMTTETRFANYSFPKEIQFVEIVDFFQFVPLLDELKVLFDGTYSLYKSAKAAMRWGTLERENGH